MAYWFRIRFNFKIREIPHGLAMAGSRGNERSVVPGIGAIVWAQQVLEIRVPPSRDGPVFGVVSARPHGCGGAVGGKRCWQEVFDRREPFPTCDRVDVGRITSVHCRYRFGNACSSDVDRGFTASEVVLVGNGAAGISRDLVDRVRGLFGDLLEPRGHGCPFVGRGCGGVGGDLG